MAIAGPTTQSDPELTYRDPNAYIAFLRSQRIPPQQIYQMVTDRFGAPKSPQEQAKDQAAAQQRAGLAQTGGTLAGMLGTGYLASQLGGGASVATPALLGATKVGAGAAAGGTAAGTGAGTAAAGSGAGAGATAGASTLGSVGSVAWPVALAVGTLSNAWETGMKDILRGRGTREDYINQAVNMGTGFLPNTALRLLGKRSIGKMMTTGKSDDQLMRDDFRGLLKQTGVANKNYEVSLADGTKFNIGLDGKTRYQNVGENIDGKTSRQAWDVDFSNPLAKYATDQIDPMIRSIYAETDGKVKPEQYTGILVNAVTSNAKSEQDVLNNIQSVIGKSNFAKQAGVAVPTPKQPITKAPKGQVVRVSPGMYVNDQGKVGPAKTMRQALKANLKGK
jgi:hypothetical protein